MSPAKRCWRRPNRSGRRSQRFAAIFPNKHIQIMRFPAARSGQGPEAAELADLFRRWAVRQGLCGNTLRRVIGGLLPIFRNLLASTIYCPDIGAQAQHLGRPKPMCYLAGAASIAVSAARARS